MNLKQFVFLVDMDGVLVNLEELFMTRWQERYPNEVLVTPDQRTSWYLEDDYPKHLHDNIDSILNESGFFYEPNPVEGALEGIQKLAEKFTVKICTAPLMNNRSCASDKYAWVEKYLGMDWAREVIISKDKSYVYGDFLIDDKPKLIVGTFPSWEHIFFRTPGTKNYTNEDFPYVLDNWNHLDNLLETIAERKNFKL